MAVTSLGYERIERYGAEYDAEHFVLLDNGGYIWNWWVYEDSEGYRNFMRLYASNLAQYESFDSHEGYRYCSLITGEDGNLYLSAFNGGETSTFYQMIEVTDAEIPVMTRRPLEMWVVPQVLQPFMQQKGAPRQKPATKSATSRMLSRWRRQTPRWESRRLQSPAPGLP